jgi:large subunit ribosomal protein L9
MARNIELLLTDNVDNLGIVGDVVKVKPGYARNFLLPRGLATKPTQHAINKLAERRKQVEAELKERRAIQESLIEKLEGYELTMKRSANEQGVLFGGVSQHDIAAALKEEGYAIEDRHIRIGESIKRLDSYPIPIVIAADLKTEIKLWVVRDQPLPGAEEGGEAEVEGEIEEEAHAAEKAPRKGRKSKKAAEEA